MDMRGHGESAVPNADQIEFERFGLDVIGLLDHLEVDSAHLAGSSAGGIISQSVAIRYPERVKSLASGVQAAGQYHVTWNGVDDRGGVIQSGVYFVRLETAGVRQTRLFMLVR